jgi:hypothetical protein
LDVLVFFIVACCALLSAVLALALLREARLRKTLEALLERILNSWRRFHVSNNPDPPRCDTSGSGTDTDHKL